MVEQPEEKTSGRNSQVPRASLVNRARPLSTDDIQKAKMRAQFLQSKYGKTGSSNGNMEVKSESINKPLPLVSRSSPPTPASKISRHPKAEENRYAVVLSSKISNKIETPLNQKIEMTIKESLGEKCKRLQIQWRTPPEMKFNDLWRVGAGENSKEVEVQKNRNFRDKQIFYSSYLDIPSNPKEPWDIEMDYDDTLTPEILTEQMPDNETSESEVRNHVVNAAVPSEVTPSQDLNPIAAEPDLELLAVLLKNPELVFALTSGQAGNMSTVETVKLLDMIKAGGASIMADPNKLGQTVEKVEVSLPSPTPSSDAGTTGWKPAVVRNPFSQRDSISDRAAYTSPPVDTSSIAVSRFPANKIAPNQQLTGMQPASKQHPAMVSQFSYPQTTVNGLQPLGTVHSHHQVLANSPSSQFNSDVFIATRNLPISNPPLANHSAVASSSLRIDSRNVVKPVSYTSSNTQERVPISFQSPPSPTPTRIQMQQRHPQPQSQPYMSEHHQSHSRVNISSSPAEKPASNLGSWRPKQEITSHYNSRAIQNHTPSGPSWGRNEYVSGGEFESWSPENSPVRINQYKQERNFSEPRINSGRNYGPDQPRQSSPHGFREQNRHGNNRRWRDRPY